MHIDQSKKFDKRNIQRNLKDGSVSHKEFDSFLSKLPDVSDKIFEADGSKEIEAKSTIEGSVKKPSTKKKPKGK